MCCVVLCVCVWCVVLCGVSGGERRSEGRMEAKRKWEGVEGVIRRRKETRKQGKQGTASLAFAAGRVPVRTRLG